MCLDMDCVRVKLQLGDTASAKALLESSKEQLASIKSSESVAFSKFYRATADYRKVVGPPNEFYNAALMFLAYTPADQLGPEDDRQQLATDMALAAVTGDNIFNFGEVIATPILAHLKGTPNAWLQDLVLAMNSGNVDTFESIIKTYKEQYFAQPVLASKHESVIVEKIRILSLMNIAFERPPHEREIRFSDIAARAKIPEDQVCHVFEGSCVCTTVLVHACGVHVCACFKASLALTFARIGLSFCSNCYYEPCCRL